MNTNTLQEKLDRIRQLPCMGYTFFMFRYDTNAEMDKRENLEQYDDGEPKIFRSVKDVIKYLKDNMYILDEHSESINHEFDDVDDIDEDYVYFVAGFRDDERPNKIKVIKIIITPLPNTKLLSTASELLGLDENAAE